MPHRVAANKKNVPTKKKIYVAHVSVYEIRTTAASRLVVHINTVASCTCSQAKAIRSRQRIESIVAYPSGNICEVREEPFFFARPTLYATKKGRKKKKKRKKDIR